MPHWASDSYRLLRFLNVVELLPTLVAIGCAPHHFFRRLDTLIRNSHSVVRSPYRTPVGFAGRVAVFTMVSDKFVYQQFTMDQPNAFTIFAIASAALMFSLALGALWTLAMPTATSIIGRPVASMFVRSVFDPNSYRGLRPSAWWGFLYLFGYWLIISQLMLSVMLVAGALGFHAITFLKYQGAGIAFFVKTLVHSATFVLIPVTAFLFRPIFAFLRVNKSDPSHLMLQADIETLTTLIAECLTILEKADSLKANSITRDRARVLKIMSREIHAEWTTLRTVLLHDKVSIRTLPSNGRLDFLRRRSTVYASSSINTLATALTGTILDLKWARDMFVEYDLLLNLKS